MVLSGILANHMQSKKRYSWFLSRRKPKAKSPDEESQGEEFSLPKREVPTFTLPLLVWAKAGYGSKRMMERVKR